MLLITSLIFSRYHKCVFANVFSFKMIDWPLEKTSTRSVCLAWSGTIEHELPAQNSLVRSHLSSLDKNSFCRPPPGPVKCEGQRCRSHYQKSVNRKNDFKLYYNRTITTQRCCKGLLCIILLMADLITPIRAALWPNEFMYSWSLIIKCKSSLLWKRGFFFPIDIITRLVPVRF